MIRVLLGCALAVLLAGTSAAAPPPAPPRVIARVADNIYRAGNGNWWSLFAVTRSGIILVDPISPDFAKWLKAQLDQRWPGAPVRYVIYSHSHWDHIEGGAVFAGTLCLMALGCPRWLGAVTPIGGALLIAGWLWLAWSSLRG